MAHGSIRRLLPPLAAVILVGAGLIYLTAVSGAGAGPLKASGTIEAVEVDVASEVSGRVSEILVDEAQSVVAGDLLLRLDNRLLEAQRLSAKAAGEAAIAAAQLEQLNARQALDNLFTDAPMARAQAERTLADAREVLDDAQRDLTVNLPGNRATSDTLKAAKAKLAVAQERMEHAESVYSHTPGHLADGGEKADAYLAFNNARIAYNTALAGYNWYTGHPTEIEQAQLQADAAVAQAQVDDAERRLEDLKLGPDPDVLAQAQARRILANALLAAARAKALVDLEMLDLQLEKLLIRAPVDGVVMIRTIEPGEVLLAGAPALSIGQLDDLTITVYLAEDRYGQIHLGDLVRVTVDSLPDESFDGRVLRIADRAEFTPRNVQTEEGRRTTVFAIEVAVGNPGGRLKPGMPADVEFTASP
jgi:HlyD family secretion protein